MATISLVDPEDVIAAYDNVVHGYDDANWSASSSVNSWNVGSSNPTDDLHLVGYGSQGLPEMKRKIMEEPPQIFVAFFRDDNPKTRGVILINFIPALTPVVRRDRHLLARALVHARRAGTFFGSCKTTLTVDSITVLTATSISNALSDPDSSHVIEVGRSSGPTDITNLSPERQSFTSMSRNPMSASPATHIKSGVLSSLLARRRKTLDTGVDPSTMHISPPVPPKDAFPRQYNTTHARNHKSMVSEFDTYTYPEPNPVNAINYRTSRNVSEFGHFIDASEISTSAFETGPTPPAKSSFSVVPTPSKKPLLDSATWKFVEEPPPPPPMYLPEKCPTERARRRLEAQKQKREEEERARQEEEERQVRLRQQREEERLRELEEAAQRRTSLEEGIRWATAERRRKEEAERAEDEMKRHELERRKRLDRLRRLEEHKRLQEWRQEQEKQAAEQRRREEESRMKQEADRKLRIKLMESKVKNVQSEDMRTGWVTLQASDSLVWRRRYFKFIGDAVFFYRSAKDMSRAFEQIELKGKLRGLKEWNEGYEELRAIPHSFAIEFLDGREPWSLFLDTEEEKFKLLGLLHSCAGLR
ncbi:hypothetical protein FISHEDRAFT_68065 [Fistulina hepatica ATCC 64428]|nr:hypothetical protein FISHEDRAFT_68065 [Fistulina hepatica ATCC 64428]